MHNNAVIILHDIACRLGRGGCGAPGGFMRVAGFGGEASAPRRYLGGRGPASGMGPRTDMNTVFIRPDGSDRPGLPDIPGSGLSLARASMSLDMDETGRITKRVLTMGPEARTHEYEYDDSGRLTRVKEDGRDTEIYEYCDLGRRIASTSIPRAVHGRQYEYDAEGRLTRAGKTSYEYDAYGNLAAKREGPHGMLETRYHHTPRGELLRVELPRQQGGKVVDYQLDPQGRRAAKAIDGRVTERYQWLDRLRLKAVLDAQGNPKAIFLYDQSGSRLPIGIRTEQGDLRFFQDQVGTLVAILDQNEEILTTLEHDSFGNRLGESNHRVVPYLGFCSGLHDRDTNLVLFGYRNYDPDVGRFITPDPLGYTGGDPGDMYEYCVDDPIHASDRTGLWGDAIFGERKSQEDNLMKGVAGALSGAASSAGGAARTGWLQGVSGAVKSANEYASPTKWLRGIKGVANAFDASNLARKAATVGISSPWLKGAGDAVASAVNFTRKSTFPQCGSTLNSKQPLSWTGMINKINDGLPKWHENLPDCPCNEPKGDGAWKHSNHGIHENHPGASNCYRSTECYGPNKIYGQQCCYDEEGKLITAGEGAGTPDVYCPKNLPSALAHWMIDVRTFKGAKRSGKLDTYWQYWPPNKGKGCEENIR